MKILGLVGRGLIVAGIAGYICRDFPELTSRVERYMREIGNQLLAPREMPEEESIGFTERPVADQTAEIAEKNGLSTVMYLLLVEAIRLSILQFPDEEGVFFPPSVFDLVGRS